MRQRRIVSLGCLALLGAAVAVDTASAQNLAIAGVVKDTSGAVLPGVTVEASSPALIEKTRSVVTNDVGLYQVVDLRPGTYTVTFTLPGFAAVRREGIALSGSFTATVNAELVVGGVQETITVSSESPSVDIKNVVQQKVLPIEVREALPTGRSVQQLAQTLPGMVVAPGTGRQSGQDVGGVSGERNTLMIHGGGAFRMEVDGIAVNLNRGAGGFGYTLNPSEAQEFVYETSGISAENYVGGVVVRVIPKDGGNRVSGTFLGTYANDHFVTNNLTSDLVGQGLLAPNKVLKVFDYNVSIGGPIKRDKLWLFSSSRYWGQTERIPNMYRELDPLAFVFNPRLGAAGNADLSRPGDYVTWLTSFNGRLTWQATARHKFTFAHTEQPRWQAQGFSGTQNYEASVKANITDERLTQGSWKSLVSAKLLLEVAFGGPYSDSPRNPLEPGLENLSSVTDTGTGYTFRSALAYYAHNPFWAPELRAAVSYVTGSHSAKIGMAYAWGGTGTREKIVGQNMNYTLRNGVPQSITVYALPAEDTSLYKMAGLFAQDQWTIRRFTLNGGLRFDWTESHYPEQTSGPSALAPLTRYAAVSGVPNWKDINPRLGVAYDLFGDGKTAVKATLGRYTEPPGPSLNAMLFNQNTTRTWNDLNADFVPQSDEVGPLGNANFGTNVLTTHLDEQYREGWGIRPYQWEMSGSVQHELLAGTTVNAGYYRRVFGNFQATDNLAVSPADYDPFCITAPIDSRLPAGVGGSQICGLYDLNPAKRGLQDNLITAAANYGKQTASFRGVDASVNVRLAKYRSTLFAGISSGDGYTTSGSTVPVTILNTRSACFVVDNPQALRFCDVTYPWLTGYKMVGTTALPYGFDVAATFQSNPGPEITANYAIPSAAATTALGRAPSNNQTIPLYAPGTKYVANMHQLDARVMRRFQFRSVRIEASVAFGNLLNASPILTLNQTFGPNWQVPTYILPGRIIRPTLKIDF